MLEVEEEGAVEVCRGVSGSMKDESVWKTWGQAAELSLIEMLGGLGCSMCAADCIV